MMTEQMTAWWRMLRAPRHRWLWYVAAGFVYLVIVALPLSGFSAEGKRALAVAGVAAFLWVTNAAPSAITGIVVLFLLPVSGALSSDSTYAYFGNHAVFLVLGVFILASPIMRSGLSSRIALWTISYFGRSQERLVVSILWLGALMSFVISEHAVAAMLFPIVLEIVRSSRVRSSSRFGLAAFLALAWGVVIGGTATILGGARAPLAMGVLKDTTGITIGFLEWTVMSLPMVVVLLSLVSLYLMRIARDDAVSLEDARQYLLSRTRDLGPISAREKRTAGIMLITIALWIFQGNNWGLDTIALLGVLLAFVFRVAQWEEVESDVNWGIIVMYGGAIALSAALRDTGAANTLAQHLLNADVQSTRLVLAIVVILAMALTEIMSNAASVAVLMPVALVIAESYGLGAKMITVGVAVPAGLAFMIPVSTPAIAIILSAPYVRALDVLLRGVWLKLLGLAVFLIMAYLYWPLIGASRF
ncbi:MAG: DASS family sodium-coupled anion symporter [Chloroflexi bacterium]|nr:DASS family sodium-coupled anion symporter [Chloroflexota bacterium]